MRDCGIYPGESKSVCRDPEELISQVPQMLLEHGHAPRKSPPLPTKHRTSTARFAYRCVLSQMLELGRQMETELHTGALVNSSSTASAAAPGMAGIGGSKGVRSRTAGAATVGPGGRGEGIGAGAGAGAEAGDGGKHHSGLLSEMDDSRSRSRGAKVGRLDTSTYIRCWDDFSHEVVFTDLSPSCLLRRPLYLTPLAPSWGVAFWNLVLLHVSA